MSSDRAGHDPLAQDDAFVGGPGDDERGGDPVCWMHLICPDCGLLTAQRPPPVVCPRCGHDRS